MTEMSPCLRKEPTISQVPTDVLLNVLKRWKISVWHTGDHRNLNFSMISRWLPCGKSILGRSDLLDVVCPVERSHSSKLPYTATICGRSSMIEIALCSPSMRI